MSPIISMGVLRGLLTLVLMLAFIGMVIYVYSKRNRSTYEQAAKLPLEDSVPAPQPSPLKEEGVKQRSQS